MLRCQGGKDVKEKVKKMLNKIMTKRVIEHYSFLGSKGKKRAFKDHAIYELFISKLFNLIKKNYSHLKLHNSLHKN